MRFKTYKTYVVSPDTFLDKIMQEIPNNALINKGRCGIGGTTLEIDNKRRCSIIVAPTRGILHNKKGSHCDLFIVDGDVRWEDVKEQLLLRKSAQKIMTTPESFSKIIRAARWLRIEREVFDHWFLLVDECHTFISEAYRKDILLPFDYFWEFKNKAIISATPYHFSEEKFYDLHYHEVKFTEKLGIIKLFNSVSPFATLGELIKEREATGDRLHVFVNSVTEIVRIALRLELTDFNIFCADDNKGENMKKLGALARFYVELPNESNFQKVNFYTCKYFEGWDMHDEKAVIVLLTDIHNAHTMVAVGMKLKQAAGRWRKPIERPENDKQLEVIHITNHRNISVPRKPLETYKVEYMADAQLLLRQHADYLEHCKKINIKPKDDPRLAKYADFTSKTMEAFLQPLKVDQQVNEAFSLETYNHIDLIKQEWKDANFDVVVSRSTCRLETKTAMERKSKATQLKEDYLALKATLSQDNIVYSFGESTVEKIRKSNPLAYDAAKLIDEPTMDSMKYNIKRVQGAVILATNMRAEVKLLKLVGMAFTIGGEYARQHITDTLNSIFQSLNIRDPKTGKIKASEATDLMKLGWFDISPCKLKDAKGKFTIHGFRINRVNFAISAAA